jgi:lysophospholipase L1-like esterase
MSCLGGLVVLLLMVFAAAEVALRVADAVAGRDASFYLPRQDLSRGMFAPHPYLGLVMRPGETSGEGGYKAHINSLGMRGPETTREKPEGVYRVLCIGSSTTYGTGATQDDRTYPARLQQLLQRAADEGRARPGLRYEVLNGGVSGYNTADSLINLELRLLELQPDAVLTYDAANDGRLIQMKGFLPDFSHARRPPPLMEISALERFLLGNVRTYARLVRGTDPEQQVGAVANWVFVPGSDKLAIPASQGVNEYGLSVYRRNLRSIVAVARAAGAEPLFQTFAVRSREAEEARGRLPFIDRANQVVHELGAELGVGVVPVAEQLTGQEALYDDWIHFDDKGELRHAQVIAEHAAAHGLLGLR